MTGDEADRKDETWCLYDGQLIDDELYFELSRFAAGVRILVLSDSCHSGTVTRDSAADRATSRRTSARRLMPDAVALRVYREHKAFYDQLQRDVCRGCGGRAVDPDAALAQVAVSGRRRPSPDVQAGSAADLGLPGQPASLDGEHNGAFTEQLLAGLEPTARSKATMRPFMRRIRARLPASQSPKLFTLGAVGRFLTQKPFTV